jgi:nitrogen fixation NifU-like protein
MDVSELYQEVIIDHNKSPRNYHTMEGCSHQAEGFNPLCGDRLTLYIKQEGDRIIDASFVGEGCAISTASASLMTEMIIGKTVAEAHKIFSSFHQLVTEEKAAPQTIDKLAVLAGVRAYPARVKCATLAWHTLESALKDNDTVATTE